MASYHRAFKCCINLILKYIYQACHMQQSKHTCHHVVHTLKGAFNICYEGENEKNLKNVTIFKHCCRDMQKISMCLLWAYNIPLCLTPSSITAYLVILYLYSFTIYSHTINIPNIGCYKCLSLNTWIEKTSQQVYASLLIKWMRMILFVQCYEHSFANQNTLQVLSEKMCFFCFVLK